MCIRDSLVTIRFRSLIILQVHLCQRPEKIRLIQIWLRINYLVEILNRKPVSYTHLDVYKRQDSLRIARKRKNLFVH